ncbi:RsiV family protein [Chryseobacterium sp.]|uniref:RsiV family protein n=1 Tax=Chryseobacterium sp. TaxID=1871047 RepID=UPI0028A10DF4|nr:RsiV family protein [Chryseobacterium sp.]
MKRTTTYTVLIAVFFLISCNKTVSENKLPMHDTAIEHTFIIDSLKVNDSVKVNEKLSLKYESKVLLFPSITDKSLLDSIYYDKKGISDFSKQGLTSFIEKEKNNYFSSLKGRDEDWMKDLPNPQTWDSSSLMKLKSLSDDFLQIEYMFSSYEGGAHGNYGFANRVFDLKNNKKVQLTDITSIKTLKLQELLEKNINKIPSGTTDDKGNVKNSDMLLVDVIPANNNFYFDDKNLYFHYSPYEIAAFAAGDIVIPISWQELKGTLNPQFAKRMKIQ